MTVIDESPDGFNAYVEYIIPEKWIVGLVLALTIGLGETFFSGVVIWFFNRVSNDLNNLVMASLDEVLFIVGMIAVHEGIHYVVALRQGHTPTGGIRFVKSFYGIREPVPYVIVLNKHISRNQNIAMLIGPLLVIDAIALIGLLPIFPASVAYFAKIVLVVNTASSMQDVYNVVRLWTMEEGTQFINIMEDDVRSFYCEPKEGISG